MAASASSTSATTATMMSTTTQVSMPIGLPSARLGSPTAMAHDIDTVLGWRGRTVRDSDGDKIGTFGDVYLDRETDMPAWAGVNTGLFGRHESFIPLEVITEAEDDLVVPYSADEVKGAPRVDPDV